MKEYRRTVKAPKLDAVSEKGKRVGDMLFDLTRAFADNGYLHVPYTHPHDGWAKKPKDDARWRVFPPWRVGGKLNGRKITAIRVERNGTGWAWIVTTNSTPERTKGS